MSASIQAEQTPSLPCPPGEVDQFLSRPTEQTLRTVAGLTGPILVLGAGGKMGFHLSLMLRMARDRTGCRDAVVAVSRFRSPGDRLAFERNGIVTQACDLLDETQRAALPDAPTVFFMAGVKFGTASEPERLKKSNVDMPVGVAHRFRHSRIVMFSSGCVYPFMRPDSGGAVESTPLVPVGDYAASCVAREQAFIDASARHGARVVLIRLNYSVEFRYGVLVDIALKVKRGEPVDVTMGHVNVIWQNDALNHIVQAVATAASPAVALNITGQDIVSVRELAHRFGELFGRPAVIVGEEAGTAWLNNAAYSHRLFGPPATPVGDMVRWVAGWLREDRTTLGKPTGFDRRDGQF